MGVSLRKPQTLSVTTQSHQDALAAAKAYYAPKMINGVSLCPRGRVYRAFELAGKALPTLQAQMRPVIAKLCEDVERAQAAWVKALEVYELTARFSGEQAEEIEIESCQCEGCKLLAGPFGVNL